MKRLIIPIFLFLLISCKGNQNQDSKTAETAEAKKKVENPCEKQVEQGLEGNITYVEGDVMPGPDGPNARPVPVQREVLVFKPIPRLQVSSRAGVFFSIPEESLIAKQLSSLEGCYRIPLPPGEYTVVINEPGKGYFANIFDGQDRIQTVVVKPEFKSKLDIVINYNAAY